MSKKQPEALRLADALAYCDASVASQAAAELRRQRDRIEALTAQRDELLEFIEEVRRSGDTRLASMAIAYLNKHQLTADTGRAIMTKTLKQAAQQALEALEARCGTNADERKDLIPALRAALEGEGEAQPVAWYVTGTPRLQGEHDARDEARRVGGTAEARPLYTTPQPAEREQASTVPPFNRVAQSKLESLLSDHFKITGYAIEKRYGDSVLKGFIDSHGFVGWWSAAQHPSQPQGDHPPLRTITRDDTEHGVEYVTAKQAHEHAQARVDAERAQRQAGGVELTDEQIDLIWDALTPEGVGRSQYDIARELIAADRAARGGEV